jgi:hypothetical protein
LQRRRSGRALRRHSLIDQSFGQRLAPGQTIGGHLRGLTLPCG